MNIEIINTGSELLLGLVTNTHQQWLCRQLADRGYLVFRQVAVADSGPAIQQAVREAMTHADLIITTGGLGPTSDDLTRDLVAELLEKKLLVHDETLRRIEEFFAARRRPMPANVNVQALVPEGASVLPNAHGTAPGLAIEFPAFRSSPAERPGLLIMLPGPPRELRPMFSEQVVPIIQQAFPLAAGYFCLNLKTTGLGESFVEEKIAQPLHHLTASGLELGYCARVGEVDVRISARGDQANEMVREGEAIIRRLIGKHIFGTHDDQLEAAIVRLLTERKQTVVLAESCTGGYLAHRLTNVPGASAVLLAGWVTYSNQAKVDLLGVKPETLAREGAVSEAAVREMAEGARLRARADYALAVTGIAGPAGGTPAKPVGTVFIALAAEAKTRVLNPVNRYDRETFKFITSQQALELLRRCLLRIENE